MGFHKAYLPEPEELRSKIDRDPDAAYLWLSRRDGFIGPEESVLMAREFLRLRAERKTAR